MVLQLKAKHFKDADYQPVCDCPIARAAMEQTGQTQVSEWISMIFIGGDGYTHDIYGRSSFYEDLVKARNIDFSDEVIRTIELTPKP